jgi:hypothetical protein
MKNKKVLALLFSLVLLVSVALFGTLAVSAGAVEDDGETLQVFTEGSSDTGESTDDPLLTTENGQSDGGENLPASGNGTEIDLNKDDEEEQAPEPQTDNKVSSSGVHDIDTCDDECSDENCECSCHKMTLFKRLMACSSIEEVEQVIASASEEEFEELTEEEILALEMHISSLEPEPAPRITVELEPPVKSEIVYADDAKAFTDVAPFKDPVVGGAD